MRLIAVCACAVLKAAGVAAMTKAASRFLRSIMTGAWSLREAKRCVRNHDTAIGAKPPTSHYEDTLHQGSGSSGRWYLFHTHTGSGPARLSAYLTGSA